MNGFTRFAPQHDAILVLPENEGRVGSLYLPAKQTSLPTTTGTVVATGPGAVSLMGKREPMDLPVGAKVLIRNSQDNHVRIKVNGVDHLLVKFGDILGSIED